MNGDDWTAVLDTLESVTAAQDDLAARLEALEHATQSSELDPRALPEWVEWLRSSYGLEHRIPAGWAAIPGLQQELAALRAAYVTAYDAEDQPQSGVGPVQWHDALQRVLTRIEEVWHRQDVGRRGGYTAAALSRRITDNRSGAGAI